MCFQIMANITSRCLRDVVKFEIHCEKMIGLTKNSHYRSALLDEHIYHNYWRRKLDTASCALSLGGKVMQ